MEDYLNDVDASSEQVVDAQPEATETSEVAEEGTPDPVVEVAKPQQTAEENARFAAARRQAENEANALRAQNDRLMQALGEYGYQGSPEEIADALFAQTQGISVEEATAQRLNAEAENAKMYQLQAEIEAYRQPALKFYMAQDLQKVKSTYPNDEKVQALKDISELDNDFFALMSATKDPILAYDAYQAKKSRETKPVPKDIGAVNSSSSKEKDFYTPSEAEKLTSEDYDRNPSLMEIVRKSMYKWK